MQKNFSCIFCCRHGVQFALRQKNTLLWTGIFLSKQVITAPATALVPLILLIKIALVMLSQLTKWTTLVRSILILLHILHRTRNRSLSGSLCRYRIDEMLHCCTCNTIKSMFIIVIFDYSHVIHVEFICCSFSGDHYSQQCGDWSRVIRL